MARAPKGRAAGSLSRERIEEAALALVERDGLDGFSTRKLAAELGCEAMSIYHYFPSKGHLLDGLFDRLIGGMPTDDPARPWRERLEASVAAYRAMAHRHPRFFQFIALHRHNTRVGLAWLERTLSILRDAGLGTEAAARYFRVVGYYVVGGVLDETAGYGKGQSAAEPVPEGEADAAFPLVAAVNRYFKPPEYDATFRIGLDLILDGIAREVAATAGAAAARREDGKAKRSVRPGGRGAPS